MFSSRPPPRAAVQWAGIGWVRSLTQGHWLQRSPAAIADTFVYPTDGDAHDRPIPQPGYRFSTLLPQRLLYGLSMRPALPMSTDRTGAAKSKTRFTSRCRPILPRGRRRAMRCRYSHRRCLHA
jgi:hypothetical protein